MLGGDQESAKKTKKKLPEWEEGNTGKKPGRICLRENERKGIKESE